MLRGKLYYKYHISLPFFEAVQHFSVRHYPTLTMYSKIALASILKAAYGQQIGTVDAETHPALTWEKCTAAGSCTTVDGKVVLDSNWRWVHDATSGRHV